jgi:hypothetical protein
MSDALASWRELPAPFRAIDVNDTYSISLPASRKKILALFFSVHSRYEAEEEA